MSGSVTDAALRDLARRSVEIITDHQDAGGAYTASPTFPVYRFSWLRDGAFVADAMSRAGHPESAERFFEWCARVVLAREEQVRSLVARAGRGEEIHPDEHLPTRFTVAGDDADEDWWDFQLDGYGTWVWALATHRRRHRRPIPVTGSALGEAVATCATYLCAFWDHPCFDWWEEHVDGVHTSTLGAIHAGLVAATPMVDGELAAQCSSTIEQLRATVERRGTVDGHLVKTLDAGPRVDASLVACCTPFRLVDPIGDIGEATYRKVVDDLAPDGVHRYLGDTYFGGGRWVVLAGLVGWHEAATGRRGDARRRLEWMWHQRTDDGLLPEQVTTHTLDPSFIAVWEAKWGPVATPLLWSHAMYLILADELGLLHH